MRELLKKHFGYDDFRPLQADIIAAVMEGKDTLVLMPTGGGKSLCYQLPSLALDGLTLVVSPLIALMKDQVDALRANGIAAEFLNSTQPRAEQARVQRLAFSGELDLLYVAPERIVQPGFQQFLNSIELSLVAVDEAHCISEWGHEFRPDYRNLRVLRRLASNTPFIALTATATERVRDDIVAQLELRLPSIFTASFNRPNLHYTVLPGTNRFQELLGYLRKHSDRSAIIYRNSRNGTEDLVADLSSAGIEALPYHAGLGNQERESNQRRFVRDEVPVIVATVAFGMGIDKPDIRLVAHYEMPQSIERYYQETGRAGRDGLDSDCVLFFAPGDRDRQTYFIDQIEDETERAGAYRRLDAMLEYAQGGVCRRKLLVGYFGEALEGEGCDGCDVCLADRFDATIIVQKILSAVIRTGQRYGATYITQVLRGSKVQAIEQRGHHRLPVYGIVDDYSQAAMKELIPILVGRGLLSEGGEYPVLSVTPKGRGFLRNRETIHLPALNSMTSSALSSADGLAYDRTLFEKLRGVRTRLAQDRGVPPHVVFGDTTLREMAYYYPQSEATLLRITGVGQTKLQEFGSDFLKVIQAHANLHSLDDRFERGVGPSRKPVQSLEHRTSPRASGSSSLDETRNLVRRGLTIQEIAQHRGLAASTISQHVEQLLESGSIQNPWAYLPSEDKTKRIELAFDTLGDATLNPVRKFLGDEFSFREIRLVRAHRRGRKGKPATESTVRTRTNT